MMITASSFAFTRLVLYLTPTTFDQLISSDGNSLQSATDYMVILRKQEKS